MVHSFRFTEGADRPRDVRSRIIEYLASNGASKVSEISSAVLSSRDNVRYHLGGT